MKQDVADSKERLKESKNCLVCQSEQINCLIKPCNHVCVCQKCILKLEDCPLDRQKIKGYEKIYLG